MEGLLGFVLAGFALIGSPGPATLSLAATGAAFGARNGLPFMAGIVSGMVVVMVAVAAGLAALILALPGAPPIAATLAAAYIVYLAYRIATAPPLAESRDQQNRPSFMGGVLLAFANPKGWAAMTALFSGFVLIEGSLVWNAAIMVMILATIMTITDVSWLFVGAMLTRVFREPRLNRLINVSFAVLLVASVALTLLV
ncbi:MAG: LysE family transporter [Alphaproteobacteria bacterium]|nr:LysE family transporter [Alphaproteobacteria bacterium]